jgi:DNA recombination protein RmuC
MERMIEITAAVAALASIVTLVAVVVLASRQRELQQAEAAAQREAQLQAAQLAREQAQQAAQLAREDARSAREELSASLSAFSQHIATQMTSLATVQNSQIDAFAKQLAGSSAATDERLENFRKTLNEQLARAQDQQRQGSGELRLTLEQRLENFRKTLDEQLGRAQEQQRLAAAEMRQTIEQRLERIQKDNAEKLESMRKTVDEKLHETLEKRLGESFKLVSDRLEAVHKGLGEMQTLAAGVGDLKRVLTNVKTRGTWGEVQLSSLLEQILTPEQYAANVATRPGSRDRVEFAIRLPGGQDSEGPLWMPIDAKFPNEDYERLLAAQDRNDLAGVEEASKAIETRLKLEAKTIREKYIEPPHTTDFALLFLPTEGLYAEALRRPGLSDTLQRDYRVTIAGPTTLTALLNSLQMGFRTLAIEKRSSEVWQVLGAVKTEFGKFGDVLANTKRQLAAVANSIDRAETRTRAMERTLKTVEALPDERVPAVLGPAVAAEDEGERADRD